MNKKMVGSLCAGLMVAGAVATMSPGVAAADTGFGFYDNYLIAPSGAEQGLDSPFGTKLKVFVSVFSGEGTPKCSLTVAPTTGAKAVYKSSILLKKEDAGFPFSAGSKTTTTLKKGTYVATTTCLTPQKEVQYSVDRAFEIKAQPALTFAGTATCFDEAKDAFVRPKGVDVQAGEFTYKARLSAATTGENRASTSKFTYQAYETSASAVVKCLGTAAKPGYTERSDSYDLPKTDVVLVAGAPAQG